MNGWKVFHAGPLFKLEISIWGPIFGSCFCGKLTVGSFLKAFGPQKAPLCVRLLRLTYTDRQTRLSRFCWVRWQETNKMLKKTKRKLLLTLREPGHLRPADDELLFFRSFPRTLWLLLTLVLIANGVLDPQGVHLDLLSFRDRPFLTTLWEQKHQKVLQCSL
jgi:hypothetical protein